MNNLNILLRNNYIDVPVGVEQTYEMSRIATVAMNLSYYGYSVNAPAMKAIMKLSRAQLEMWWERTETELKNITGEDRNMADFVVYKNFPAEVLEKSEAEYWFNQILMYWGLPNELFTQEVQPREGMDEAPKLKVLRHAGHGLAYERTLQGILNGLVAQAARWKAQEQTDALYLADPGKALTVDWSKFGFKENLVATAVYFIKKGLDANVQTATDVLRLAVGLSDGDVSLREKTKLKKFKRKERRFLLSALNRCSNLEEDFARRPEVFKRLVHALHPGDYKDRFPKVVEAANKLYHGNLQTFNSLIESALAAKDPEALEMLATRPGEFRRRLVHCLDLFGQHAVNAFVEDRVLNKLTVAQLVTTKRFLEASPGRQTRCFPPRGNWTNLKVAPARKVNPRHALTIAEYIGMQLRNRVPKVKHLDPMCEYIKLPSNDGEVSPYGRGTVFPIPDNIKFIRTASYWECKRMGNVWFDNGWNFYGDNWEAIGTCCWNSTHHRALKDAAVFSGDPTNTKDMKGRAAQMIDLYLDELQARGVRYAVWNILCYSRIAFSQANEVYASLQWGEKPAKGKLFEPSRCQLNFSLSGDSLTKYIAYIDVQRRELVYMDANLKGNVRSALSNEGQLAKLMPAYVEYLNALPTVADLFSESVDPDEGVGYIVYSDKDVDIKPIAKEDGTEELEAAYVFKPENEANAYNALDINLLLK